ncbi:hypothetical protein [Burkholderia ambifaria]|jgi:hypothetical protein|uniref:hypothetical protein n=1 Tax=Burkholderia ambifaria TaxID=152480 RepID=UPI00158B03D6|nr:hypothetical protein [Burkholderia ambifaria]
MGDAKRRGTREERIAQAKSRNVLEAKPPRAPSQKEITQLVGKARELDPLIASLTTPTTINDQISQFAQQLGGGAPMFLECQPEPWSRQSCCDLNVAKYIETHGGRAMAGYRIWYAEPRYIEGERHAVWTDGNNIRDVSFVDTGETTTVFVPDELGFDDAPAKVRFVFEERDKQALEAFETLSAAMPFKKMSDSDAWATYPTYERWRAGERMPNILPVVNW